MDAIACLLVLINGFNILFNLSTHNVLLAIGLQKR